MKKKALLIDIGNSSIDAGLSAGRSVKFFAKLPASESSLYYLRRRLPPQGSRAVVFSSVVPRLSEKLRRVFKNGFSVWECGREVIIPIKNLYSRPQEVGQDRLLNCFAARRLYPQARVVVDLGTALTFDFMSGGGDYLGGLIVPGVFLSQKALLSQAALLPQKVEFRLPKDIIARTTAGCINAGVYFGYNLMIKGVLDYYRRRVKAKFSAVGCGGDIKYISRKISSLDYIEPRLSLKGLYFLAKYKDIV